VEDGRMKRYLILLLVFTMNLMAREIPNEQKITGLYVAFFNRAPDMAGLMYWSGKADHPDVGQSSLDVMKILAAGFATHSVFVSTYEGLSDREFVERIYINALGKDGDEEGIDYWSGELSRGLSRSDMVAIFVNAALAFDITKENYPTLSEYERLVAKLRQDLITYKTEVALDFVHKLKEYTNITADPDCSTCIEENPAYRASILILSGVTDDNMTAEEAKAYLSSIAADPDPVAKILSDWHPLQAVALMHSCIINTVYKNGKPSDSLCIEQLPQLQCDTFGYDNLEYENDSFMEQGSCVALGFDKDKYIETEDLTGIMRKWYYRNRLFESVNAKPVLIDWEANASNIVATITLPDNAPVDMNDINVEVVFNDFKPDNEGHVLLKIPKEQITDAYVILPNPQNNEEYVIYLFSTLLPGETETEISVEETAISLVLNGIDHRYLTQSGTPGEVKSVIVRHSTELISYLEEKLDNDPYWLTKKHMLALYRDSRYIEALRESSDELKSMYSNQQNIQSRTISGSGELKVLPCLEIYDFKILADRKSGDMTGNLAIENDTMIPARYSATNLFTKMPIHLPGHGIFGDLISAQTDLMHGYNASSTTVKDVDFQPSKITVYTAGWVYLPHDTPNYDFIKSQNRDLNERVLLDNVVMTIATLIPLGNKQVFLKVVQWLSQQTFFRIAMDEYYSSKGRPEDLKNAIINILKGFDKWENYKAVIELVGEYYGKNPVSWVKEKVKWVAKIASAEVGIWIYAADLASLEKDLMETPPYIDFTQITFPVFLKYYDPDSLPKVTTTEESRRVTLTGEGLFADNTSEIELEALNKDGEYEFWSISGNKLHQEGEELWFDLPYTWLNTGSDITGPIYFQLISKFTDAHTSNDITVKVPKYNQNEFYKIVLDSDLSITNLSKTKATRGTALRIYGKGFSSNRADNTIYFSDNNDHVTKVTPTYSTGEYMETIVPENLPFGKTWVQVGLKDGHESNEKTFSLIPEIVKAVPMHAYNTYDFEKTITFSLSQNENVPIFYTLGTSQTVHHYTAPLTLTETTTIYPFARVTVEGVNYDSEIVSGGYVYYKCADNEKFEDGECMEGSNQEMEHCPAIYDSSLDPYDDDSYEMSVSTVDKDGNTIILACYYYSNYNLEDEIPWFNEKWHGIRRQYFESGSLWIETPYTNYLKNGIQKAYYESGSLYSEITFIDGKENGMWISYNESGSISRKASYIDGKENGTTTTYYESGQISDIEYWTDGKRTGTWKYYYESGCMYHEEYYENDKYQGYTDHHC